MNLELTEEQVALRDTTRRFLAEKAPISTHVRQLIDDPTGVDEAVWRGLADLGTTGLRKDGIDGTYGPATAAQVRAFQAGAGIAQDGVVGAVTWQKLLGV